VESPNEQTAKNYEGRGLINIVIGANRLFKYKYIRTSLKIMYFAQNCMLAVAAFVGCICNGVFLSFFLV